MCGGQGVCENTLGSYKCVCPPGYQGNGTHCEGKQLVPMSLDGKFWILSTMSISTCALVLLVAFCIIEIVQSGRIMLY